MLEEYLKYLLYEKNYSAHTVSSYANDIGQFIEYYTQLNNSNDIENAEREYIRSWQACSNVNYRHVPYVVNSLR